MARPLAASVARGGRTASVGARRAALRTMAGMVPARRILVTLAWLVPLGVLVQAALAGQALFVSPRLFGLHGGLGHGVLVLAIATAGLAWLARVSRTGAALASLAVLGLVAQTGLGYVGHRSGTALASAVHVPLGVALLGLTVATALLLTLARHSEGSPGSA